MISCHDADVLAAALSVGSLDTGEERGLQQHLSRCVDCRRLASEYMEAAARLPLALTPQQPSPELRGRLMRAVYAEASRSPRQEQTAVPASWWQRLWAGIPAARALTTAGAFAAVALIAVTSWTLTRPHGGSPTVSVALVASQAAPNAHGQLVIVPSARAAVLTVSGLPSPSAPAGAKNVYEVWLLRPSGAAEAAAYLSQAPDGTWTAAMHGDMSGYASVAATVEPAGGSLAPTGTKLFVGYLGARPSPTAEGAGGSS